MADITVTAADVAIDNTDLTQYGFAGEAITTGQLIFRSGGTTGTWYLVDIDALATAPEDQDGSEYGISLNSAAAAGAPVAYARSGSVVSFGGVLTTNTIYKGSVNPGGITADATASGDFGVLVGHAISGSQLSLRFQGSGVSTA